MVPDVQEISRHAHHQAGDDLVRVNHRLGGLLCRHVPAVDLSLHQSDGHFQADDHPLAYDQHPACVPEATAVPDESSEDHRVVKVEDDHDLLRDPDPVRNELA